MTHRTRWLTLATVAAQLAGFAAARAQGVPPEVAELRRRVAAIRHNLPDITSTAELAAGLFTNDSTLRFLISQQNAPAMAIEFTVRAGGPPETRNADDPTARGLVIMPVRSWDHGTLGAAMQVERWRSQGRIVFTIGSAADRPARMTGDRLIDNGAPSASSDYADINGVANLIAAWTFYAEVVAAATRDGWQPGIYRSDAVAGGTAHNRQVRFRMPTTRPVPPLPAGQLGAAYLAAIDSLLDRALVPEHQAEVTQMADSLRRWRASGARLYAASCGHYLLEELPHQNGHSPFIGIDWRWDVPAHLTSAGVRPGDAILWFGYAGYDCPHAEVATPFADAGLKVALVSDRLGDVLPPEVRTRVELTWPPTDAVAPIPFAPSYVAPASSIDMALHYLWIRRLVGDSSGSTAPGGGS